GANQRVGEGDRLAVCALQHDAGQVLQVDLVHDAGGRRNDAEIVECLLPPLQELVPFAVALEFEFGIVEKRQHAAKLIDLHGVVDNQVDRYERVDLLRVTAHARHGIAQRGQVDDAGHAGEVLQNDACGLERNLDFAGAVSAPACDGFDRLLGDLEPIGLAKSRLEQDTNGEWQTLQIEPSLLQGRQ